MELYQYLLKYKCIYVYMHFLSVQSLTFLVTAHEDIDSCILSNLLEYDCIEDIPFVFESTGIPVGFWKE